MNKAANSLKQTWYEINKESFSYKDIIVLPV